jgi:phenylalanyl-tRNA synthetase beta chain
MKIPLSWLREYVDFDLPVAELARRLTLAGLEVSGVQVVGLPIPEGVRVPPDAVGPVWAPDKIVTARVVKVEKHPNADKLKLVTAEYGAAEPKVCVTGAPNIAIGDRDIVVVLGLAGTQYWDGHATPKQIKELKPSVLRGIPSDAMVMSEFELGISEEHEGIIVLPADTPVGVPAANLMAEIILEADILPNMARCLAMLGVGREVAALTGKPLRSPPTDVATAGPPIEGKVTVAVEDSKLSARYAAMLIQNVTIGAGPAWMQRRLQSAGMRPINAVVDVTNYVMLEWGQPLHAFDYDVLVKRAGGKPPAIAVRPAKAGETLVTLDKIERKLTPETLIIADTAGPIALAGVMGGLETEVSADTKNILLESANFDIVSVRRTMRALDLPSEASLRFSKGIHPDLVVPAVQRAARLLHEHAAGTVCRGFVDTYPRKPAPQVIDLSARAIRRLLGVEVPLAEASRLLTALDFKVQPNGKDALRVTSPANRLDIQVGEADLIEEIARLSGYDRLPATLLADPLPPQVGCPDLEREEQARDRLVTIGLQEVITYSLTTPEREAPLAPANVEYLRLVNPISTERAVMRHTVLAGVLEVVAANLRHADSVAVFEIGTVYLPRAGVQLPDEPRRLALALTGPRTQPFWQDSLAGAAANVGFFNLKGLIETLLADLHVADVCYRRASTPYLHPGRSSELIVNDASVGSFGELHPRTARAFDLADRSVMVAELDLDAILTAMPERFPYLPVPRFPAALRDVAVVVPEDITAERVADEIRAAGGEILRDMRLFDLYRGPSIPPQTKSLAFALSYQADDRTLADKEIDKLHKKVEDRLVHVLKASIRGKEEKKS